METAASFCESAALRSVGIAEPNANYGPDCLSVGASHARGHPTRRFESG